MRPPATVRLTPAIVMSRRTQTSSITPSALSRSRSARSSPRRSSSRTCRSIATRSSSGTGWRASRARPRPSNRQAMRAARDQLRGQDRADLVLEPRAVPHDPAAPRREPAHPLRRRVRRPDPGQAAGRMQARRRARTGLVGPHTGMGDGLHLQGIGDHHPRREGREPPATPPRRRVRRAGRPPDAPPIRLTLDHHLLGGLEPLGLTPRAPCGSSRPARRAAARAAPGSPPPASGPVDVEADHASHARAPAKVTGAAGDTTPDAPRSPRNRASSTRRPATNASSQLIVCIGPPAPSRSRSPRPGCSARSIRRGPEKPQQDVGPADLMPVANPLERLFAEERRRLKIIPNASARAPRPEADVRRHDPRRRAPAQGPLRRARAPPDRSPQSGARRRIRNRQPHHTASV